MGGGRGGGKVDYSDRKEFLWILLGGILERKILLDGKGKREGGKLQNWLKRWTFL